MRHRTALLALAGIVAAIAAPSAMGSPLRHRFESRIGDACAVVRPAGYVEAAVAAEETRDFTRGAAGGRNQAQEIVPVGRMAGCRNGPGGKKDDPSPIRGGMGEPVVVRIACHLLLVRAVRAHAPNLHAAGAVGVE